MSDLKYYVGLDMGTNSVGWAVTDPSYCLLRAKGKDMWGVREFDEAQLSAERRTQRISRRRLARERARIGLLKTYFEDEIKEVDPLFYVRLDNSKYFPEDKDDRLKSINGIFDDPDYTDKEYYSDYPTIFHLRKELIENSNPHDVRLVFLAILNMFKHRGHFLDSVVDSNKENRSSDVIFNEFRQTIENIYDISLSTEIKGSDVINILKSRDVSRSAKVEKLLNLFGIDKKYKEIIKLVCGLKVKVKLLFPNEVIEDDFSFSITDSDIDEKLDQLSAIVDDSMLHVIETAIELYNKGALASILGEFSFLSEARVASYEEHKRDLKLLKQLFREKNNGEDYDAMFRGEENGSYSAYVNSTNSRKTGVSRRDMSDRSREKFYKSIKNYFKKWGEDENTNDERVLFVYDRISREQFMPKQLTASNGVIPNHIHAKELKMILKNAEQYLPFLNETDESGYSVSERIEKLFSFQIPYYVGPTSAKSEGMGGNGWVVRKSEGAVLPWNISDKIDLSETRKEFIKRLIRDCTYLNGEKVLPKASLLYEKFCVLNEINNIRIDGNRMDSEIKQQLYSELYLSGKRVTRKKIIDWLRCKGIIGSEEQISGIDININNQLSSYNRFVAVFGDDMKKDRYKKMAEDIAELGTIFGDAKSVLKEKLASSYGDVINENQMKKILGWKMKDWTRLSKAFLELEAVDKSSGEVVSLISAMWTSSYNLMELINSDLYSFKEELEKKRGGLLKNLYEFKAEDLKEMYFSAPVRRMIWQTILILREIETILGCPPSRVFIEMTRQPDDKKERKDSRGKQLTELYKSIKGEEEIWAKQQIEKIKEADEDGSLRSKKLYLYYTQMGRDMYTGEHIELEDLLNRNMYDIDHIYPQHFVKDDNISNNMVLVNKSSNNHKQDYYPLESSIRNNKKVRDLWTVLHKYKLINNEKYHRLTRNTGFSEEEKASFIARQFVETSQGTKGVADLLKSIYDPKRTTIVYAKARNVSDFRNGNNGTSKQDKPVLFPKSRLVNDNHHANDAYLNIVVGNAYYVKFTQNPLKYIQREYSKDSKNDYHLNKMFDWDIRRGDEIAWVAKSEKSEGTIETVKRMMEKNTPLLTRLSYEGHGAIANATLYSAKKVKDKGYIPLKTSDDKLISIEKYGGLSSVSTAYFFLVEHDKGKKRIRTIETVPIYLASRVDSKPEMLEKYCIETLGLINPSIRLRKIKLHSLVNRNGYYAHMTGVTGNQIYLRNATSLILSNEYLAYVKKIEKYVDTGKLDKEVTEEENCALYCTLVDKHKESIFRKRPNAMGALLEEKKSMFVSLTLEDQVEVLYQIINLTIIGKPGADLRLIGGASSSGGTRIGKNITETDSFYLINQSVTGLIVGTPVDLLRV